MASLATSVWAVLIGGTTTFDALPSGAAFRFPKTPVATTFVKGKNGWFTDVTTGKKFKTGGGSAVVLVKPPVIAVWE